MRGYSPNNNIVPQSLYGSRDNVSELPGMRRFNLADRNRNRLRFSLDWQTTERCSLATNADFDDNDYLHDRADTIGTTLAWNGLWRHRLDLSGDLVFTRAQTDIGVNGASYANNPFALAGAPAPLPAGSPAVFLIPAADLPPVVTRTFEVRLSGRYALSSSSDLRLIYEYARTKVEDFAYEGLQPGTGTEQMPTLEQAPNYVVQVVALFYRHRF